ncbi:glycosyltransferase family 39 protein [Actinoplanes oblitus]|uniref:Glycosyltransferase family 39 protein n=1 Tax=Actinoplanes oblitus TaxID=3040509 RepID=A0ABY8W8A4_9ACTN|nr:glycosyltransferase family 39 protein [Actinoplanes oblitus]WIM94091.1 glycosyltransferase family 39 protein [Actinoplanes oblitus]
MTDLQTGVRPAMATSVTGRIRAVVPGALAGLLMLAVALTGAGRPRLSWDEVTSAEVSQRTIGEIWQLVQHVDAVFAAYYWFLHVWTGVFGDGELALRLPSILAMAGAVGLAAELGRRLFSPLIGLVAGLILVIMPNTSRYAAEARPYAFVCFFSMLALLLLITVVGEPARIRGWVAYSVTLLLLGGFHLVSLTTLAAHAVLVGVAAWRRHDWRLARTWLIAVVLAMLPLLPLARFGTQQDATQLHWVKPITIGLVRAMPGDIVGSSRLVWLLIGLAVLATWRPARRIAPIAVLALAPFTVVALVSALVAPMWVARYMLVVLAPLALLAAVALVADTPEPRAWRELLGGRFFRIGAVLLLLAFVALPGQQDVRGRNAKNGPDYRGLAELVGEYDQPGDVIVYPPKNRAMRAGMDYYLRRQSSRPADVLLQTPAPRTGLLIAGEYPDDAARVAGAPEVWLIVADQRPDPLTARPGLRELLTTEYAEAGRWHKKHATAVLYRRRG